MAIPPLSASVPISHSCNWKCCFGCCKDSKKIKKLPSPISTSEVRVQYVYRHARRQSDTPRPNALDEQSKVLKDMLERQKEENYGNESRG